MRSVSRSTGANQPIVSYPGTRPTINVDRPMIEMVTRKVYLRPTRSPSRPNTRAPKGRTRKPAENVNSATMNCTEGSNIVQNLAPIWVAVHPYR